MSTQDLDIIIDAVAVKRGGFTINGTLRGGLSGYTATILDYDTTTKRLLFSMDSAGQEFYRGEDLFDESGSAVLKNDPPAIVKREFAS